MRHYRIVPTAILAVLGSFAAALASAPAAASPLGQEDGHCIVSTGQTVSPAVLLGGETTTVELHVKAVCMGVPPALMRLILVLDASGGMAGEPGKQIRDTAMGIVRRLDLPGSPGTRVGVVRFNSIALTVCPLMNDEAVLLDCIARLGSSGGTAVDRGIVEGLRVLTQAQAVSPANDVMIVIGDGLSNSGCSPVLSAARRAKSLGVLLITICVSGMCDAQCMREVASSSRYFFPNSDPGQLATLFDKIRSTEIGVTLPRVTVTEDLPVNMELIDGSIQPPALVSDDRRKLIWNLANELSAGTSITFRLRPLQAGYHATSAGAVAEYTDIYGDQGSLEFPIPFVSVFAPLRGPLGPWTGAP